MCIPLLLNVTLASQHRTTFCPRVVYVCVALDTLYMWILHIHLYTWAHISLCSMIQLIKPSADKQYVDLTVSFTSPEGEDDLPGPPVRYYFN